MFKVNEKGIWHGTTYMPTQKHSSRTKFALPIHEAKKFVSRNKFCVNKTQKKEKSTTILQKVTSHFQSVNKLKSKSGRVLK